MSQRTAIAALLAPLALYLCLAVTLSRTRIPICDEGWYADPAFHLAAGQGMGTSTLDGSGDFLSGIGRHTYWIMPVHILTQSAWYHAFTPSLFSLRALSITAGLIALAAWTFLAWRISARPAIAFCVLLLAATDANLLSLASIGRSDMLSAALGASAQAAFLLLRARGLGPSLFVSHSLAAAAGLTHPIGGLASLASLLVLQLPLERRLLSRALPAAAAPYLIAAALWATYISQDPAAFAAQFGGNSAERLWPLTAPWLALQREFSTRILAPYRQGADLTPLANLRLLLPLFALASTALVAARRHLRLSPLGRTALIQAALVSAVLFVFEGAKQPWYLLHLVFPLCCLAAMALLSLHRPVFAFVAAAVVALNLAYPAAVARQNKLSARFLPLIAQLSSRPLTPNSVLGGAELGFGLGFDNVHDDHLFGYATRHAPNFIVLDPRYRGYLDIFSSQRPEVSSYARSLIDSQFHQIYADGYYTLLARIPAPGSAQAAAVHLGGSQ